MPDPEPVDWTNLFEPRNRGDRVIGTYLRPLRYFGPQFSPYSATEVIRRANVSSYELLITRMPGLFLRPPMNLADPYRTHPNDFSTDRDRKLRLQVDAATRINEFVSELALNGIVSEPASPAHLAYGQMVDNHALVTVGALPDAHDFDPERTIEPAILMKYGLTLRISPHPDSDLDEPCRMRHSTKLAGISNILPSLVAGAYYSFWRGLDAEALNTAWIVVEQIIDHYWKQLVTGITDKSRRTRLGDAHVYTAAVRLEILMQAGVLPDELCTTAHKARRYRNDLAHRATLPPDATEEVLSVMHLFLQAILCSTVAAPQRNIQVTW